MCLMSNCGPAKAVPLLQSMSGEELREVVIRMSGETLAGRCYKERTMETLTLPA